MMLTCSSGHAGGAGERLCRICGLPFGQVCPNGHPASPDDPSCPVCGDPLGPGTPAAPPGRSPDSFWTPLPGNSGLDAVRPAAGFQAWTVAPPASPGTGPPQAFAAAGPGAGPGRQRHGAAGRRRGSRWGAVLAGAAAALALGGAGTFAALRESHAPGVSSHQPPPRSPASPGGARPLSDSPSAPGRGPEVLTADGVTVDYGQVASDPVAPAVAATMAAYFGGIDAGDYRQAWSLFTAREQAAFPFRAWSGGLRTSHDSQVAVAGISRSGSSVTVSVDFQSRQAAAYGPVRGQTCTDWSLAYLMVPNPGHVSTRAPSPGGYPAASAYLIARATVAGAGPAGC